MKKIKPLKSQVDLINVKADHLLQQLNNECSMNDEHKVVSLKTDLDKLNVNFNNLQTKLKS